jgi:hypothetical protein
LGLFFPLQGSYVPSTSHAPLFIHIIPGNLATSSVVLSECETCVQVWKDFMKCVIVDCSPSHGESQF